MREWTGFSGGVEVTGQWSAESEKAIQLIIDRIDSTPIDNARKWIPKSQIEASIKNGSDYKCIVATWLGNKLLEELA